MLQAQHLSMLVLVTCLVSAAPPQEIKPDVLELENGRILRGRLEKATLDTLHFLTTKGMREVPRAKARQLTFSHDVDHGTDAGARQGQRQAQNAAGKQKQPTAAKQQPVALKVPAGTPISVRMDTNVSSNDPPGGPISGTVVGNVRAGGKVAIPAGSSVYGRVVSTGDGVRVQLTEVNVWGRSYKLRTTTQNGVTRTRMNNRAAGAAVGALVGSAVDGSDGAWRGVGIGSRVAGAMGGPGEQVIEPGTQIEFRLNQPLTVKP